MRKIFTKFFGPLWHKLIRDIGGAKGQFFAVVMVIACGIGSYITITFAFQNLITARDNYCREYRLADLFFIVDRAPRSVLTKIKAIPGVTTVQGRIVFDVPLDLPNVKEALVGRIISLPDKKKTILNDIHIVKGQYFNVSEEQGVLINPAFCEKNNLRVGDSISATINNRKRKLQIRATALSPEYIYTIRTAQDFLPNPQTFAICYVKESFAENTFGYQEAVNDITVAVSGREFLDPVKTRIEEILEPYGLLMKIKQEDQVGYKFLANELAGLKISAKIFPMIFLIVASLTIFIMLHRIVINQRGQIGVLKALGYRNWQIILHYLGYACVMAFLGCLIGVIWGHYMAGNTLNIYKDFYRFPVLENRPNWQAFAIAMLGSLIYCCMAGTFAVWQVTQISPATAMRPAPPITGKHIFLEKISWLWNHFSFAWKMITRNICRHPSRSIFIIIGISFSTAILIYSLFIKDAMTHLIYHEFKATQKQDIKVFFFEERPHTALYELRRLPYLTKVEPIYETAFEFKNGWRKKIAVVTAFEPGATLHPLLNTDGVSVPIEENELIISEKLAQILNVRVGDMLTLKPLQRGKKECNVKVNKIVSQYLGLNGYMSIRTVSHLLQESYLMNGALLKVEPGQIWQVHTQLKKRPAVATVIFQEVMIQNFAKAIGASMEVMTGIISLFAGIIAFAIIYNSAVINISERQRELATLKVMGFYNYEVTKIVFHEYFLLASLGLLLGFPLGRFLCDYIAAVFDTEIYRVPVFINTNNYFITFAQIFFFVLISQWACRYRLHNLDMVEVLKIRE